MYQEKFSPFFEPKSLVFGGLLKVIDDFGSVKRISSEARGANNPKYLEEKIKNSKYEADLNWLKERTRDGTFSTSSGINSDNVTLEISACNHLSWLITEAKQVIEKHEVMPTRFIRVRSMKEQESDDLWEWQYAMKILGASNVQTLGTKGTMLDEKGNPINVHLNGGASIAGYFGGVGIPNNYALEWAKELLYYHTKYGVSEFLNVNYGTYILGLMLYKLGVNARLKVSVFMGIDNPYSVFNMLLLAKLFARKDGTSALAGLNFSNSVNVQTILEASEIRRTFGFEESIRFEHHITEAYEGIVRQPYDRLEDLLEAAKRVKNLSAKHEGGLPSVEATRSHPSSILDYFRPEKERKSLAKELLQNYMDKHEAVQRTAKALALAGIGY